MKWLQDEGLVLFRRTIQDDHQVVHLFTRAHGCLQVVARGIRCSKRPDRFGNYLDVLSWIRFKSFFRSDKDLGYFIETDLLDSFLGIRDDVQKMSEVWVIIEVLKRMYPVGMVHQETYQRVMHLLHYYHHAYNVWLLPYFIVSQLHVAGQICKPPAHRDDAQGNVWSYVDAIVKSDFEDIMRWESSLAQRKSFLNFLIQRLERYIGRPLSSCPLYSTRYDDCEKPALHLTGKVL